MGECQPDPLLSAFDMMRLDDGFPDKEASLVIQDSIPK
jgi:hypothetical protein